MEHDWNYLYIRILGERNNQLQQGLVIIVKEKEKDATNIVISVNFSEVAKSKEKCVIRTNQVTL